jgi:NADH-quinone oxidoreductase subunit A
MLSEFGIIIIFIVTGLGFLLSTFMLSGFLSNPKPNPVKLSTYESGEESVGRLNSTFNPKYYVIGLAFLLFEVELILLFPWALIYNEPHLLAIEGKAWFWMAFAELAVFILLLLVGLIYIWKKGYFEWGYSRKTTQNNIPDIYTKFNHQYSKRKD